MADTGGLERLESGDIVFFTLNDDWREEIRFTTVTDFSKNYLEKAKLYCFDDIEEWDMAVYAYRQDKDRVDCYKRGGNPKSTKNIKWKEFDPRKMIAVPKDTKVRELNIKDILKSGRAPGIVGTIHEGNRGSLFHNHKLDEGAMGDLIDKGLDGAVKRAESREKKYGKGHAFQAKSFGRRMKGHGKRKGK